MYRRTKIGTESPKFLARMLQKGSALVVGQGCVALSKSQPELYTSVNLNYRRSRPTTSMTSSGMSTTDHWGQGESTC